MKLEKQAHGGALVRYEEGTSGNPKGKPPGTKSFKKILKDILAHTITLESAEEMGVITKKQALCFLMIKTATDEDEDPSIRLRAAQQVMEKIDGKPTQPVDHKNDGGKFETAILTIRIPTEPPKDD